VFALFVSPPNQARAPIADADRKPAKIGDAGAVFSNEERSAFENSMGQSMGDGSAINLGDTGNIARGFRRPRSSFVRAQPSSGKIPPFRLIEKAVELRHLNCVEVMRGRVPSER
jgi:hypothetical protein